MTTGQESLFLSTKLTFEKTAVEARLSDNSDTWPQELMQELLKQHPYLGSYDVTPVMTEVNGDRGYGLGYFIVANKSARQALGPGGDALKTIEGVRTLRIPIIVKETSAKPFDVFVASDGAAHPLTDFRVRQALYRPQLFDTTKKSPGDVSIADQLYPPSTQSRVIGGGQMVDVPVKTAEAKPEYIMEAIAPTILRGDIEKLEHALSKSAELVRACVANPAVAPFIEHLAEVKPTSAGDIAKVAASMIIPDVVQVTREGDHYVLKMANSQMFAPEEIEADRPTMVEQAGEDLVQGADELGSAIVSADAPVKEVVEDEQVKVIDQYGVYKVKDANGKEHLGWVWPTTMQFDGTVLPMAVFTNGSVSAIQPQIAGTRAGATNKMLQGKPEGHGFFYRVTQSGEVIAFVPVEIKTRYEDEKGVAFAVEDAFGEQMILRPTQGFNGLQQLGESEYAVPGDIRWAPLGETAVKMMEEPEQYVKTAAALNRHSTVRIISDGGTWTFSGGAGVEKLAADQRSALDGADAHFLACSLGMSNSMALQSLIKAAKFGECSVPGCRELHLPGEYMEEMRKTAADLFSSIPRQGILIKEAVGLEDMSTVDKVLSVGFLNPENVQVFINYLPDFETAIKRLSELLIATRMGMADVPEEAAKSAMERLDEVSAGLRKLMHREAAQS